MVVADEDNDDSDAAAADDDDDYIVYDIAMHCITVTIRVLKHFLYVVFFLIFSRKYPHVFKSRFIEACSIRASPLARLL